MSNVIPIRPQTHWCGFLRRVQYPKLAFYEHLLDTNNIQWRHNGWDLDGHRLEVNANQVDQAWELIEPYDEMDDNAEIFEPFWRPGAIG